MDQCRAFSYAGIGKGGPRDLESLPVSEFFVFEMRARFGQALLSRL